jgi:hypothetical protein
MDKTNKDLKNSIQNNIKNQNAYYISGLNNYNYHFKAACSSCPDSICVECRNDHSFRNNFEDIRTSIDALPELFPKCFVSLVSGNRPQNHKNRSINGA